MGEDFRPEDLELLRSHRVDTTGLKRSPGRTFRWKGVYGHEDIGTRETLDTQLNVFAHFSPRLTGEERLPSHLFLANTDPELQLDVLGQMNGRPSLVALDTMNFWIEGKYDALRRVVEAVDVLLMDEGEARTFAGEVNLVRAARHILRIGPTTVIVKRGEHGVLLFRDDFIFAAPAFPLESVVDPTGAGDSFAGGFMGHLATTGDLTDDGLRRATALGCVMGSFAVESFSADRLRSLTHDDIEARFRAFTRLSHLAPLQESESLPWRGEV